MNIKVKKWTNRENMIHGVVRSRGSLWNVWLDKYRKKDVRNWTLER